MKVTVCINETKIVVPCGDGDLSVRELAELAIIRYRKTALSKGAFTNFIEINSLKLARDGGILDWDDKVHDVLDDRDLLIAQHSSNAQLTTSCPPGTLSSPPLPHHSSITTGDNIITSDTSTASTSNLLPVSNQTSNSPQMSTKYVPLSFGSSVNPELYTSRHNSIPCSDQDIHRHFDFFDNTTTARHESLDDILDYSNPNRKLHNFNSLTADYEKWPLPPFPTISTLQSSTDTTVLPNNMTLQLHDVEADDLTWDNSPNDGDEEDYPRLRPDYIVKHFKSNQGKSMENSVPCRQVLQWLESQECGSVSSSGGGGGVGTSSYEAGSDVKESESTHITTNVLDDRNNNRVHVSYSSVSSGNEHNRLREDAISPEHMSLQHCTDNAIIVRLTNIKAGENLGIQIVPVYLQANTADRVFDIEQKCIAGIEVYSIVPKGRVAKERQLNKGDKIIQINDINLTGMLYESAEAIFRESLQKPECKLRVIPFQYSIAAQCSTQLNKLNPPPPPRRSPNTALSGTKSNSGSSDKGVPMSSQPPQCRSPISNTSINIKSSSSKLNPAPPPPSQQKPVASWTSGLGSMVHTPASSTSSVSAVEKKKPEPVSNNIDTTKHELIELTKIGSGFGFSITGADNVPPNIPSAVFVRHILPDGAAIRDGRLKSDDRILEVDGLLLEGMSQSEVISLLREKPSGSRVKLLVERNAMKKNSPCSASHDSLMTSLSEIEEDGSTLSKNKKNTMKLHFDIPLNDNSFPDGRTSLGISVKVEPNWDKTNITPFSSKEEISASNIVWVKTVIENGAAYRHGKLMVGDQLLEVNGQSLSGLSSEEALSRLKNIIKDAQDSEEGIIKVVVTRKINMARSSSLNTLNSLTGSGSAISSKPIFDHNRNLSHKISNFKNYRNVPPLFSQTECKEADIVPNKLMVDLPNPTSVKPSVKPSKRSAPLPPTPDPSHIEIISTEKAIKSKPVPPPPPLARRLKNCESNYDSCQFVPISTHSTPDTPAIVDQHYANHSVHKISESNIKSDEFPPKTISEPQCSSTTNTLCRNKENSQLILRARNTRSNCSYTPTNEILHLNDIDWDKMELIPFDNCQLASVVNKTTHNASTTQVMKSEDAQSKGINDTGVSKRKPFKKFSLGHMFKLKHPHETKTTASAGPSPTHVRKQNINNDENNTSENTDNAIPITTSSYSLKSSNNTDETEFPYAELDFSHSPATSVPEHTPIALASTTNNPKISNPPKNTLLLPLPEESFKFSQSHSSEESDSYDDFVDMQTAFPGHISAVQRIAAATPKQPPNRFVYEDAEELFQCLQSNVSPCPDTALSPAIFGPLSTFSTSQHHSKPSVPSQPKDIYQNVRLDPLTSIAPRILSPPINPSSVHTAFVHKYPRELSPDTRTSSENKYAPSLKPSTESDLYLNWPVVRK